MANLRVRNPRLTIAATALVAVTAASSVLGARAFRPPAGASARSDTASVIAGALAAAVVEDSLSLNFQIVVVEMGGCIYSDSLACVSAGDSARAAGVRVNLNKLLATRLSVSTVPSLARSYRAELDSIRKNRAFLFASEWRTSRGGKMRFQLGKILAPLYKCASCASLFSLDEFSFASADLHRGKAPTRRNIVSNVPIDFDLVALSATAGLPSARARIAILPTRRVQDGRGLRQD